VELRVLAAMVQALVQAQAALILQVKSAE
jgi:hypothetical protein